MKKPMKGARRIVVNDKEYYWLYRGSTVIIWPDGGRKSVYSDSEVTGWPSDTIERGKRKGYFSLTPRDIAVWINKEGI